MKVTSYNRGTWGEYNFDLKQGEDELEYIGLLGYQNKPFAGLGDPALYLYKHTTNKTFMAYLRVGCECFLVYLVDAPSLLMLTKEYSPICMLQKIENQLHELLILSHPGGI